MLTTIAARRRRRDIKEGRRGTGLIVRLGEDDDDDLLRRQRKRFEGSDTRVKIEIWDVVLGAGLLLLWGYLWGYNSGFKGGATEGAEAGIEVGHEVGYCDGFNDSADFAKEYGSDAVKKIACIARASLESGTATTARAAVFEARADIIRGTLSIVDAGSSEKAAA